MISRELSSHQKTLSAVARRSELAGPKVELRDVGIKEVAVEGPSAVQF